jgi:hypothetical protein
MADKQPGQLQFIWWEADPRDEAGMWWGQLASSTYRLILAAEHLGALPGRRKTEDALNELTYHLENYFARTYELRERAVGLMEKVMGYKRGGLGKAKSRDPLVRSAVAAAVPGKFRVASVPFFSLLDLVDDDINIRNDHTHSQFLNVVLATDDDFYDPLEVLEHTWREGFPKPIDRHLRREISRLGKEYGVRAGRISKMTWEVIEATQRLL